MPFSLTWLPEVLRAAGLKVAEEDGWKDRGRGEVGQILGVMCHHTATKSTLNMPTLNLLKNGRKASPGVKAVAGPLAQLGLGRDGTYFVIAAGRCNHAGEGSFKGVKDRGNLNFIGIEAENSGLADDPWPDVQLDAYRRGIAAILKHLKQGTEFCVGHKEYAPGRKPDPSFDMDAFRSEVEKILNGTAEPPKLIPPEEPPAAAGAPPGRKTLRRGDTGELVKTLQTKIGVDPDGKFGPNTEAKLRIFQREHGFVPDGIVGPKTWAGLDKA